MQFYYLDHHPALLLRRRMQQRILWRRWLRQQQLPVDYLIALLLRRMGRQWLWQRLRQFLLLIATVFHQRKCKSLSSDKNWELALPAPNFLWKKVFSLENVKPAYFVLVRTPSNFSYSFPFQRMPVCRAFCPFPFGLSPDSPSYECIPHLFHIHNYRLSLIFPLIPS